MRIARKLLLVSAALIAMLGQSVASAAPRSGDATAYRLGQRAWRVARAAPSARMGRCM